jgi:hypothetical protein
MDFSPPVEQMAHTLIVRRTKEKPKRWCQRLTEKSNIRRNQTSSDPQKCEILFPGDSLWKVHGYISRKSTVSVTAAETGTVNNVEVIQFCET